MQDLLLVGPALQPSDFLDLWYFFAGLYRKTFSEKFLLKNCTNGPSPNAQISVPRPIRPPDTNVMTAHSASVKTRQPK